MIRPRDDSISAANWREIDRVCGEFEAGWNAGQRPDIAGFLDLLADQSLRPTLLQELLAFGVEHRLACGESPQANDYADLDPQVEALFAEAMRRASVSDSTLRGSADGAPANVSRFTEQTIIGKFRLVERLGSGGFGEVWKAEDTDLERTVALKLPLLTLASDKERDSFLREAKTVADIRHPGVVRLLEAGNVGPRAYLASDYIDGSTLRDWLSARRLGFRDAALLVERLAEALEHAHRQGVVHRDVKPTNILIDRAGQPLLTDFGLAKRLTPDATLTIDDRIVGSPGYMSPEQAAGRSGAADARSDVYSLGVVLFELLTGETPFRGDAAIVLQRIQHDDPLRPRQLNPTVPRDLETIALRCMEKSPARRYQTAGELAAELTRYRRHEPILARPVGPLERGRRWCKRHPALTASAAVLVVATLISVAFAAYAQRESLRAQQAEGRAVERATEYERLAHSVEARYELDRGLLREAFHNITAAMRIKPSWQYQHLLARIVEASRKDWTLVSRIDCDQAVTRAAFLPQDSNRLLVQTADRHTLTLYDLTKSKPLSTVKLQATAALWKPLSPRLVAVVGDDQHLRLLALPELTLEREMSLDKPVNSLAAAPTGDRFAVVYRDGEVVVFAASDLRRLGVNRIPLANNPAFRSAMQASFSPSGEQLVMTNGEWTAQPILWRLETNEAELLPHMQQHYVRFLDEERIVGAFNYSGSSDVLVLHVYSAASKLREGEPKSKEFPGNSRGVASVWLIPANSPNADEDPRFRVAVFGDEGVSTIDGWSPAVSTRIEYRALLPHLTEVPRPLDLSIDGPRIALAAGNSMYVFQRRPLPGDFAIAQTTAPTRFWSVALSPTAVFTPSVRVDLDDRGTLQKAPLELPLPVSSDGHVIVPWGMAVTPDERLLAVLYQEGSDQGTISADYFGKILVVYERVTDPSSNRAVATYRPRNQFFLASYYGLAGRTNRGIRLTSDGKRLIYCSATHRASIYDAATGMVLADVDIGTTITISPDGRYFAHAKFNQVQPVTIVSSATGEIVGQTATAGIVRTMCFDPAGEKLIVGWRRESGDQLQEFRIDGTLETTRESRFSPFAVHPRFDEYLGFRPQTYALGTTVLVETSTGRLLEELDHGVYPINVSGFTADGKLMALPQRDEVVVLRAAAEDEAVRLLNQPDAP